MIVDRVVLVTIVCNGIPNHITLANVWLDPPCPIPSPSPYICMCVMPMYRTSHFALAITFHINRAFQVKDCIHSFFETRDHMRRLYRWVVVLGEPEPLSNEAQAAALKEMKELEADGGSKWSGRCECMPVGGFPGAEMGALGGCF